jgi:hypothetical protein
MIPLPQPSPWAEGWGKGTLRLGLGSYAKAQTLTSAQGFDMQPFVKVIIRWHAACMKRLPFLPPEYCP